MGEYADLEVDKIIAGFERRAEATIAKQDLKPNQCEVCGKRFWTPESRNQHAKDSHRDVVVTDSEEARHHMRHDAEPSSRSGLHFTHGE